jgi:hypothetical protein
MRPRPSASPKDQPGRVHTLAIAMAGRHEEEQYKVKIRTLAIVSCAAIGAVANASVDMDHIDVQGGTLGSMPVFGVMQIMSDVPFSGTVIDDFYATGNIVDSVSVAFEITGVLDVSKIRGYQISFWSSVADPAGSGFALNGNTVAQAYRTTAVINPLGGTSAVNPAYVATFNNLNLNLGTTGHYWIGVAVDADFQDIGQTFILENSLPYVLGAWTQNDAVGIDPTNSFTLGTAVRLKNNAAYEVSTTCVPEPGTLAAIGLGIVGLISRRRSYVSSVLPQQSHRLGQSPGPFAFLGERLG